MGSTVRPAQGIVRGEYRTRYTHAKERPVTQTRPRAAHRARRAPSVSRRGGRSDPQGCDVNPGNDGDDEMAGS